MTCAPSVFRRAVTIGMVGAVAVLVAVGLVGRSGTGPVPIGLDVAVGVLACAVVAGLPRWPVTGAVVLVVLAAFSLAATPPATLAGAAGRPVPAAAARRRDRAGGDRDPRRAGRAASRRRPALRMVAGARRRSARGPRRLGALLRARRDLLHSLRERAHRAETEQAERVAAARSSERTVIARELHDVLAHRLSLVAASAGALEYRPDAPPEQVARAAGGSATACRSRWTSSARSWG